MRSTTLADLLEASAAQFPSRPAVVDSTGAALTYSQLHTQSDVFAAFLRARGVGVGDRVAIAVPKTINTLVSIFGVMKAGAAYVPVDSAGPVERGRRILEDCGVRAAVINTRTAEMIPEGARLAATIALDRAPVDGAIPFEEAIDPGRSPALDKSGAARPHAHDLAYIIFTSGSTGMPKGAMITHANVLSFLGWCSSEFRPSEHDRFANYAPLYFDASVFDIYLGIKHGACVYVVSDDLAKRPKELAAFIATHKLTVWLSTPSALTMLVRFGELDVHDCSSFRLVTFGGEVFPPRQLRELQQKWPETVYYNLYGPTEATIACTFARVPSPVPADRSVPYPIGFPCSHCSALLLDDKGHPVDEGEEGLLHIGGPSVFAGYWNRHAETAAVIHERDGIRWYNTGDLVRWDAEEGFTFIGRKDGMVKRRGFRIELGEIERSIYLHPKVNEAAVVSVSDGDAVRIVAFLVCAGPAPTMVEMKAFCANTLPAYMSPDAFVFLDHLPRTPSDKVDVQALKRQVMHAGVR